MRTIFEGAAAALILAPAAALAQYYDGDYVYQHSHDHVGVYHHGDHNDVVRCRHPHDYGDRSFYSERRHHHHDFDD